MTSGTFHYTTGQYAPLQDHHDTCLDRGDAFRGSAMMDRPTFHGDIVVADGLPLERLYSRFDAIARGRANGDGPTAFQSVINRLASIQRRAEMNGWTSFVLERSGDTGRLELRGAPTPGEDRILIPEQILPEVSRP
jgi:hypothetical protein